MDANDRSIRTKLIFGGIISRTMGDGERLGCRPLAWIARRYLERRMEQEIEAAAITDRELSQVLYDLCVKDPDLGECQIRHPMPKVVHLQYDGFELQQMRRLDGSQFSKCIDPPDAFDSEQTPLNIIISAPAGEVRDGQFVLFTMPMTDENDKVDRTYLVLGRRIGKKMYLKQGIKNHGEGDFQIAQEINVVEQDEGEPSILTSLSFGHEELAALGLELIKEHGTIRTLSVHTAENSGGRPQLRQRFGG